MAHGRTVFDEMTDDERRKMLVVAGEVARRELRKYRSIGHISCLHNAVKYGIVEEELKRREEEEIRARAAVCVRPQSNGL